MFARYTFQKARQKTTAEIPTISLEKTLNKPREARQNNQSSVV